MERQTTLSDIEYGNRRKKTRREKFLETMDAIVIPAFARFFASVAGAGRFIPAVAFWLLKKLTFLETGFVRAYAEFIAHHRTVIRVSRFEYPVFANFLRHRGGVLSDSFRYRRFA